MKKLLSLLIFFSIFSLLYGLASDQDLKWESSLEKAMSKAKSEQKLILLIAGTTWDSNTVDLKEVICESDDPPVKSRIQEMYVPWYVDLGNLETEHAPYIGLSGFSIPTICIIHPENPDQCLDRRTGAQSAEDFLDWLNKYKFGDSLVKLP